MAEATPALKRLLDYKLLFDCLADEKSGKISVHSLSARWPKDTESEDTKIPRGCIDEWRAAADQDGYLDWETFSTALATALKRVTPSKTVTQGKSEGTLKLNKGLEHFSIGKSLVLNPVKSSDIEGFLAECEGQSLVKALARMKKEVYSCQSALQQQQQQQEQEQQQQKKPSALKLNNEEKVEKDEKKQNKLVENSPVEKTDFSLGDAGNEKEELLKGIEILKQTEQWFQHRLDQLEKEGSSKKKPSAEELLAILEGSSVHPAAKTLHHIQKINAHLSSLALHAPVLAPPPVNQMRRTSTGLREERKIKRLMSEPGPSDNTARGPRAHRATVTLPAQTLIPVSTETGAHVIGIDIPTNPVPQDVHRMPDRLGRQVPRRSHSFQEIRVSHPVEGRIKQTSKQNISSLEKSEPLDKRSKPQRSHSFSQKEVEEGKNAYTGTKLDFSSSLTRTQGYPLRETVSLSQLPHGSAAGHGSATGHGYSSYGSASQRMFVAQDPYTGTQGSGTTLRSSSMMTLPSRDSHVNQEEKMKKKSRSSSKRMSEKEELRARQAAAQQHIMKTEMYQGPLMRVKANSSHSMV